MATVKTEFDKQPQPEKSSIGWLPWSKLQSRVRASRPPPRWLFPSLILAFALGYYSAYALSGLDLQGEGGTIGVIALRLNTGARPITDTYLGYNLFWFAPISGLFALFGPSYLAIKALFFSFCTLTGLLGYRILYRATRQPLLSLAGALLIILVPGMQFRNYLGFLAVANMLCLLETFVVDQSNLARRFCWLGTSTLLIALTYLFRIDLGTFFSVLLVGAAAANLFLGIGPAKERIRLTVSSVPILLIAFILVHLPVDQYAKAKGFERDFRAQYTQWWTDIGNRTFAVLARLKPQPQTPFPVVVSPAKPPADQSPVQAVPPPANDAGTVQPTLSSDRSIRALPDVRTIFFASRGKQRELAFLLYAPVVSVGSLLLAALVLVIVGLRRRNQALKSSGFTLLIGVGSSLTLFPQYFFFRPDPPHLSEMMCPYVLASVMGLALAVDLARTTRIRWLRAISFAWALFLGLHLWIYARYGVNQPWMGAIAMKKKAETRAEFANQVIAYLPQETKAEYEQLFRLIGQNSRPEDYVVCFPYSPMIGFMTNRRSYRYNLYVDNSTRSANFDQAAIAEIEKYRPAIIAIDDVAMNGTPGSRFSAWAAPTLQYIQTHYDYLGRFVQTDLYKRR
jgi:hypothetical protein